MSIIELTCIGCPLGCHLTATLENDQVTCVTGNSCKRGLAYAQEECTHPTRLLTTTLPVCNGHLPQVSAKTEKPVPKPLIYACMQALKDLEVEAPIVIGDILCEDLAHTGVNLIATQIISKTI
ncbi:MAG: DUF1667 domain-containing protein [Niameybacter sp.]|uniref:DUF1667 domain-containing protein n=1 Tax=Niameybacter sp. TaxID=2033640 RepID=UPI002FC869EB